MTGVLDDVTGREYQGVWRLWKLGSLGLFGAFVWLLADIRSIIRQHVQTEAQVSEIMLNREARRRPNETPFNRLDPRPETVLALKLNDRRGAVLVNLRSIETVTR